MDFTLLEKAILDWIADRSDNAEIRMQIRSAYPAERELTGTGSFTKLAVPPHVPKTDAKVSQVLETNLGTTIWASCNATGTKNPRSH